jgi:hypothetical protein
MSFSGDPVVEEFLEKLARGDFDINYEDPNTKRLMDGLTRYQIGKAGLFMGPLELSKSAALTAINNARLSGAIKPREESPRKIKTNPRLTLWRK